jgi:hypothetical protein
VLIIFKLDLSLPWPLSDFRTGLPADALSPSCFSDSVVGKYGKRLNYHKLPATTTSKRSLKFTLPAWLARPGKTNSPPPALPSPTLYVTKLNRTNVFEKMVCEKLSLQEV